MEKVRTFVKNHRADIITAAFVLFLFWWLFD